MLKTCNTVITPKNGLKMSNFRTQMNKYRDHKRKGYCASKRHNACMCWMKLFISVDIMLMTFRQKLTQNEPVFSQSCDLNFSTKWSRVWSQNWQSVTDIRLLSIADRVKHDVNSVHSSWIFCSSKAVMQCLNREWETEGHRDAAEWQYPAERCQTV